MIEARARVCLSALFLALALILFADSMTLGPTARLVPMAVAIPAIVLLALQLFFDLFPRWSKTVDHYLRLRLHGVDRLKAESGLSKSRSKQGLASVLAWFAAAPALIYLLGFMPATPVYTIAFLRFYAQQRWAKSIAIGVAISAVVTLPLVFAVREPIGDGWLIEWIVGR